MLRSARPAILGLLLLAVHGLACAEGAGAASIEMGKYLVAAGNCFSCHTTQGGEAFAGGVSFATPFGTLYSTNITPDPQTGIGKWTQQQFAQALREGVRPDGAHLYPAFPYTAFTKVSDADVAAIFAYLKSLPPARYAGAQNQLTFPFSQRWTVGIWKALYFDAGRYASDPKQSSEWNRGAYLVQGLGHCSMCHSPRNFMAAEKTDLALSGGTYQDRIGEKLLDWSASNLTSSASGLAAWSATDLVSYLKLGFSSRAGVFGAMNDVVVNSTRHWSDTDLRAVAAYLKSLPAKEPSSDAPAGAEILQAGELQYDVHCGTCHLPTGLGSDTTGPPLVGSAVALSADPASLINVTLYGAQLPQTPPSHEWQQRKWQVMEAFGQKLDDEEAAALLSYVRGAWGNKAAPVTAEQVARQR